MIDKPQSAFGELLDALRVWFPYLTTLFLSSWGGLVNHIQRIREGKISFSWFALWVDLCTSSFAGIVTHLACDAAGLTGAKAAILVAISGHMGARAIKGYEALRDKYLKLPPDVTDEKDAQ